MRKTPCPLVVPYLIGALIAAAVALIQVPSASAQLTTFPPPPPRRGDSCTTQFPRGSLGRKCCQAGVINADDVITVDEARACCEYAVEANALAPEDECCCLETADFDQPALEIARDCRPCRGRVSHDLRCCVHPGSHHCPPDDDPCQRAKDCAGDDDDYDVRQSCCVDAGFPAGLPCNCCFNPASEQCGHGPGGGSPGGTVTTPRPAPGGLLRLPGGP